MKKELFESVLQPEKFESPSFAILVWWENISKPELFKNDDVLIIM